MSSKESSPGSVPEKTDCLVCGSGRSFPKNPILFCDGPGCDIPVHQKCYGVDVVPSGNWYCQRCEDRIPVLNTICCLCKSDTGICSPCSADSCSRAMHVTCAQEQDLMTKGKHAQIYCDVHRDTGVLSRIMKSQSAQRRASASSSAAGGGTGRSKRAKYYGESSEDDEDDDDEDEEDDDEDVVMEEESEDDILKSRSSTHSSVSSSRGSKGHTKNKRSLDSNGRRRRNISSGSEEIDVDDTEAVLGSSLGGSTTQKKVSKSAKTNIKETAAESQRRRLLQALDKNKKKQGTGAGVFANVSNLSTMPIRTLGGIGVTTGVLGSPSAAEPKQKLPGVNRNGNNPPAFDTTSYSPINNTLSNNVSGQNNGRNPKGLTFDLDPAIDASAFKTASPLLPSGAPSPVFPNYSNSGSPLHARGGHERQQSSSKTEELQAIVQSLQNKVATLENTIQGMTQQQQHLQQKLAASNNRTPPSGTPTTAHTPTSSTSATTSLIQANPHTVGQPGQDLQYKFDVLQHTHAQDKMRNLSLRENLRDIFGFLQVSVGLPVNENRRGSVGEANVEWSAERLDEYVQMLRDTLVGTDSASSSSSSSGARPALDVKRRDMIVDRVMKEISN
ncbi:Protein AF-17 [Mortierella sp. AD031]|nr:Protein AF-17 [Mortierella sp. AD031]